MDAIFAFHKDHLPVGSNLLLAAFIVDRVDESHAGVSLIGKHCLLASPLSLEKLQNVPEDLSQRFERVLHEWQLMATLRSVKDGHREDRDKHEGQPRSILLVVTG